MLFGYLNKSAGAKSILITLLLYCICKGGFESKSSHIYTRAVRLLWCLCYCSDKEYTVYTFHMCFVRDIRVREAANTQHIHEKKLHTFSIHNNNTSSLYRSRENIIGTYILNRPASSRRTICVRPQLEGQMIILRDER